MLKITEDYIQFAWRFGLYHRDNLRINGEKVKIIDPGEHNTSSGPDFFNARVKIGNTIWAGNLEIHRKASEWYNHEHHSDPAYDSVILHVVLEYDRDVLRMNGETVPTLEISLSESHLEEYLGLVMNNQELPCNQRLSCVDKVFLRDWFSKMMISRLQDKTQLVFHTLEENKYDWEESFYHYLGKSFGFRTNAIPFSMLVETVPLKTLLRLRRNPLTVNAILFGQAGFLEDQISGDDYYDALRREYLSVKSMLPARKLYAHSWQFMRLRPANFPTVRISQFASLIVRRFPLFADISENREINLLREIFMLHTDKYWEDHMLFGRSAKRRKYRLGRDSADIIIINALLPVLFAYGKYRMKNELQDRVIRFLGELPAEKNEYINQWKAAGIMPESAFDSQAMLHLTKNYCKKRRCLECVIGSKIII